MPAFCNHSHRCDVSKDAHSTATRWTSIDARTITACHVVCLFSHQSGDPICHHTTEDGT